MNSQCTVTARSLRSANASRDAWMVIASDPQKRFQVLKRKKYVVITEFAGVPASVRGRCLPSPSPKLQSFCRNSCDPCLAGCSDLAICDPRCTKIPSLLQLPPTLRFCQVDRQEALKEPQAQFELRHRQGHLEVVSERLSLNRALLDAGERNRGLRHLCGNSVHARAPYK